MSIGSIKTLLRRLALFCGVLSPTTYAYPALDIELAGHRYLHLVGSIHMGTANMAPLPAALLQKLKKADALIVEADISGSSAPFPAPDEQPPLAERLSSTDYQHLQTLCDEVGSDISQFDAMPNWQIALMLQARQAQRLGLRSEYGIDHQLLEAARQQSKRIIELEGMEQQVDLLLQLPDGGIGLLQDTLQHWHTNARLLQTMISWWLDARPAKALTGLPTTFSEDLFEVLMNQRNQRWREQLLALPAGRYVVAVGALHLYGEGNLPELLAAEQ